MGSEQNLAQAMIELNTGHIPNMTIHERRDYLMKAIRDIRNEIELFKKENDILGSFEGKVEYQEIITKIEKIATDGLNYVRGMEKDSQNHLEHQHDHSSISNEKAIILNNNHVSSSNVETKSQSNQETVLPTSTIDGPSSVSNSGGIYEESDDEGVQLLLSMRRSVFNCKCGEYLNSITDWSEHQKICSRSVEKTIGEQCQLCKKTFLSCVALNIHSTKKHNKKKMRTDSIMHCPCGESFTAKWRQNCVHKLNSHGRHCKAFKAREIQCTICKKGFIERKSLEYHGLKAHGLAVPVNS